MLLGMRKHMLLGSVTALALGFGAYSIQGNSSANTTSSCECSVSNVSYQSEHNVQCGNQQAKQSWLAWFTGDSRSAQFHYLDLLELLSRDDSKKNARQFSSSGY
ncbi:hypothetical protein [Pseudoalteromonas pernae]|uniref:hypothetical protein n=1 Tax=Pseudoalteromonas pernae TaxID=3118054 RepID=UPI003242721F